jgi:hypothetical protein
MCVFYTYLQNMLDKFYNYFFTRKYNSTKMNEPLVEVKNEKMDSRLLEYHVIYPDKQIYI